jgi:hypothetical protein
MGLLYLYFNTNEEILDIDCKKYRIQKNIVRQNKEPVDSRDKMSYAMRNNAVHG